LRRNIRRGGATGERRGTNSTSPLLGSLTKNLIERKKKIQVRHPEVGTKKPWSRGGKMILGTRKRGRGEYAPKQRGVYTPPTGEKSEGLRIQSAPAGNQKGLTRGILRKISKKGEEATAKKRGILPRQRNMEGQGNVGGVPALIVLGAN